VHQKEAAGGANRVKLDQFKGRIQAAGTNTGTTNTAFDQLNKRAPV
jgi:hypothetical protein